MAIKFGRNATDRRVALAITGAVAGAFLLSLGRLIAVKKVSGLTLRPPRGEPGPTTMAPPIMGAGTTPSSEPDEPKQAEVICDEPPASEDYYMPGDNPWGLPVGDKPGCLVRISRDGQPLSIEEYGGSSRPIAAMVPFQREGAGRMRDGAYELDPELDARPIMPGRYTGTGTPTSVAFLDAEVRYAGFILYRSQRDVFTSFLDFNPDQSTKWWLVVLWDPGRCAFTLWRITNAAFEG